MQPAVDSSGPPRPLAAFAGIFVVTLLALLSVGAVLPVLPRYVRGPLDSGNVAVGFAIGAFAFTALVGRPFAGHLADIRGRRPAVLFGSLLAAAAGALYFVPAGLPGLIVARLVLGAGEGMVFTAGAAWVIDLAPVERRGRVIGLYGLSVWSGLSLGPPIGELLLRASSYDLVWAFATAAPLIGALVAARIPAESARPTPRAQLGPLLARESVGPGVALALATVGYAAMAAFVILHLQARGVGHGAAVFTAFAVTVVITRLVGGGLPDRIGAWRAGLIAAAVEAAGLAVIALAHSLPVAIVGSLAMGAAFSTIYPALSLVVVSRVPESRRGVALGTFTAFFDTGVGVGAPLAGAAAALAGYAASFWLAAGCAALSAVLIALAVRTEGAEPAGYDAAPPPRLIESPEGGAR
jgi:MFS family permease